MGGLVGDGDEVRCGSGAIGRVVLASDECLNQVCDLAGRGAPVREGPYSSDTCRRCMAMMDS